MLLRRLNSHLAELSAEIEATVSEALAVELEPVAIRLQPPSAQDFHKSLEELFAQGAAPRAAHSCDCHLRRTSRVCVSIDFRVWRVRCGNAHCGEAAGARANQHHLGPPLQQRPVPHRGLLRGRPE